MLKRLYRISVLVGAAFGPTIFTILMGWPLVLVPLALLLGLTFAVLFSLIMLSGDISELEREAGMDN